MDLNRMKGNQDGPQQVQVEITWRSIMRVLLGILLAYVAVVLWPIFKLLVLATLIAVALSPVVAWVTSKGGPRWLGLTVASAALLVLVVGCLAVIGPMVYRQASVLGENLPKLKEQVLSHMPTGGLLHNALEKGMTSETISDSKRVLEHTLFLAKTTVGGLFELVMILALAIYLMADGAKIVKWLLVFFPKEEQPKISQGIGQIGRLVFSYVSGQILISALCAAYVFAMLTALGVPMALLLGIIAGICDILPLVGFVLAVTLMATVGMTISTTTALLVLVLYGAYHVFENVAILPKVYGKKLKLSPVAVPLAVAAGGLLAGVVGAIAALPIVAAYPVIERLWITPRLHPDTVKEHADSAP